MMPTVSPRSVPELVRDPCVLSPRDVPVKISAHATERFRDRVRPALGLHDARAELERLIPSGVISSHPPAWLAARQQQLASFYLNIGDITLPLDPCRHEPDTLVALSCLVVGSVSAKARHQRTDTAAVERPRVHSVSASPPDLSPRNPRKEHS